MSDNKIVDFASYLARARRDASEEAEVWAAACEKCALRAFTKYDRDAFTGFCVAVFDNAKNCACVLLGYQPRVVARYNIGASDKLRRVKPTKRDDELLATYMSGGPY